MSRPVRPVTSLRHPAPPRGRPRVTVVGDALLDVDWEGGVARVCPDAPAPVLDHTGDVHRPGGAALAARFAAEAGAAVVLVCALGDDPEGDLVRAELTAAGVSVVDLGLAGPTPVKLRLRSDGQSLARVDRGCKPIVPPGAWTDAATGSVTDADVLLVSDYGRGMAAVPAFGALLAMVAAQVPVVWDPHPHGPPPPPGLDVLVPNEAEATHLRGGGLPTRSDLDAVCRELASRFGCGVALTAAGGGVYVGMPGSDPVHVPVAPVAGDACGAGDRFAATLAVCRARRAPLPEAAVAGAAAARAQVEAGAPSGLTGRRPPTPARPAPVDITATGPAAAIEPAAPGAAATDPVALATAVRAAGGTVVTAGGCFDVLHAGHVRLLESARRLGDLLVVCLNDDRSVRRLKGRHRPVNPVGDRVAVLRGLSCVDAVVTFGEDTPCGVLERLRPHLFVKGADYADDDLPEQQVLARWGGEVVFVPLVAGRSTSRILAAAATGTQVG